MSWELEQEAKQLFMRAVRLSPDMRSTFLDRNAAGPEVRSRVVELLDAWDDSDVAELPDFVETTPADSAPTIDPPSALPQKPEAIGPYQIERLLGGGGMGEVWLGIRDDDVLRRAVAIKLIRRDMWGDDPNHPIRKRFRSEVQLLASMAHQNVARLFDAGLTKSGQPFMIMEYIEGLPLDQYCYRERRGLEERIELFMQLLEAINHVHSRGVVHRDLKPNNILITTDGKPKLIDFGIARILDNDLLPSALITEKGKQPSTLVYASPEQLRGQPLSETSDIYTLGVILYHLLTGHRPYRLDRIPANQRTFEEVRGAITQSRPVVPSDVVELHDDMIDPIDSEIEPSEVARELAHNRRTTPNRLTSALKGDLDAVLLKALAREPGERYQSVGEFAHDLRSFLDERPVIARSHSRAYRIRKHISRHRVAITTSTVLILAIGALSWVAVTGRAKASHLAEHSEAVEERLRTVVGDDLWRTFETAETIAGSTSVRQALLDTIGRNLDALGPHDTVRFYHEMGDLTQVGDAVAREEARSHFQRALEEAQRNTSDPQSRVQQAILLGRLVELDKPGDQLEYIDRGLALLEPLRERNPISADTKLSRAAAIAEAYLRLLRADKLGKQDQRSKVEEETFASIEIREKLMQQYPTDREIRRLHAQGLMQHAQILQSKRQTGEARLKYMEVLDLREALKQELPNGLSERRDLVSAYLRVSSILNDSDAEASLDMLAKADHEVAWVLEAYPDDWRSHLDAMRVAELRIHLEKKQNTDRALDLAAEAVERFTPVMQRFAGSNDLEHYLGKLHYVHAQLLAKVDLLTESAGSFDEAARRFSSVESRTQDKRPFRLQIGWSRYYQAIVLKAQEDRQGALAAFRLGREAVVLIESPNYTVRDLIDRFDRGIAELEDR